MTKKLFVMQRENMKYQSVAKRITYGLSGLVLSLASLVLVTSRCTRTGHNRHLYGHRIG